MAEYTIPKPYRDFYVTDPYVGLQKEVEDLQKYSNPFSAIEYGSILHGQNTLPDKEIPVKVESKNLFPYPYYSTSNTKNGVTFTVQDDGGISVSGTPTAYVSFFVVYRKPLDKSSTYSFSVSGENTNVSYEISLLKADNTLITTFDGTEPSIYLDCSLYPEAKLFSFAIKRKSNNVEMTGTIYPQMERGEIVTSYSKPLPEGTAVNVTTCGKNLLNVPTNFSITGYTEFTPLLLRKGKTYTISCANITLGGDNKPVIVLFDLNGSPYESFELTSSTTITLTLNSNIKLCRFWSNGYSDSASEGVTSKINNLMIEESHTPTTYEAYTESVTETTVGSEVTCKQLNDNTNIFSSNIGVSLSTRFVLYNEELFHDKLTAIIGTFANRPTDITDYDRLYIATDKSDTSRSTILPAGKSGATASNWIYI